MAKSPNMFKRIRDLIRGGNKALGLKNKRLLCTPYNWAWMFERDPEAAEWILHLDAAMQFSLGPKHTAMEIWREGALTGDNTHPMFGLGRSLFEELVIKAPTRGKKPLGIQGAIKWLWGWLGYSEDFGRDRARREAERLFSVDERGDYVFACISCSHFPGTTWKDAVGQMFSLMLVAVPLLPVGGLAAAAITAMRDSPAGKVAEKVAKKASEKSGEQGKKAAERIFGKDKDTMGTFNDLKSAYKKGKKAAETAADIAGRGKDAYDAFTGKGGQDNLKMPPTAAALPWYRAPWVIPAAVVGGITVLVLVVRAALK